MTMNAQTLYRQARGLGAPALPAWRNAKRKAQILTAWQEAEGAGLVRLRIAPDDCAAWEDLAGDSYDVELHKNTVPGGERTIKAQEKAERERIDRDGVCGIIGEYKCRLCGQ